MYGVDRTLPQNLEDFRCWKGSGLRRGFTHDLPATNIQIPCETEQSVAPYRSVSYAEIITLHVAAGQRMVTIFTLNVRPTSEPPASALRSSHPGACSASTSACACIFNVKSVQNVTV